MPFYFFFIVRQIHKKMLKMKNQHRNLATRKINTLNDLFMFLFSHEWECFMWNSWRCSAFFVYFFCIIACYVCVQSTLARWCHFYDFILLFGKKSIEDSWKLVKLGKFHFHFLVFEMKNEIHKFSWRYEYGFKMASNQKSFANVSS